MTGRLLPIVGLILGLFGLAQLSDTLLIGKVRADPIATCACSTPSGNTKKCGDLKTWTECGNATEYECSLYVYGGDKALKDCPIVFVTNSGNIPDGCQDATPKKVNCGTETIVCYRHTRCKWDSDLETCYVDVDYQGLEVNSEKRKEENCAPDSACPPM